MVLHATVPGVTTCSKDFFQNIAAILATCPCWYHIVISRSEWVSKKSLMSTQNTIDHFGEEEISSNQTRSDGAFTIVSHFFQTLIWNNENNNTHVNFDNDVVPYG